MQMRSRAPPLAASSPMHGRALQSRQSPCGSPAGACVGCAPHRPLGRIPLKDVIRFKERQWFVEELEVRGMWSACSRQPPADASTCGRMALPAGVAGPSLLLAATSLCSSSGASPSPHGLFFPWALSVAGPCACRPCVCLKYHPSSNTPPSPVPRTRATAMPTPCCAWPKCTCMARAASATLPWRRSGSRRQGACTPWLQLPRAASSHRPLPRSHGAACAGVACAL